MMGKHTKSLVGFLALANLALLTMGFVNYSSGWSALRSSMLKQSSPVELPNVFSYQGRMTKGDGTALANGQYFMRFAFYTQGTSGLELCRWELPNVWVKDGNFRAQMGTTGSGTCVDALAFRNVFASYSEIWIELSVGQDSNGAETMTPRIQVGSVPRSHHAEVAEVAKTSLDGVPVGAVMPFYGASAPTGWLIANGVVINMSSNPEYTSLVAHLRANGLGAGLADDSARLPDLRGVFLRGKNFDRSDAYRNPTPNDVGEFQADVFASHNHGGGSHSHTGVTTGGRIPAQPAQEVVGQVNHSYVAPGWIYYTWQAPSSDRAVSIGSSGTTVTTQGGDETRPRSVTVLYVIKY